VKKNLDCETARLQMMASLDGEPADPGGDAASAEHLASCESCQAWRQQMEAMTIRLRAVTYPDARRDLWTGVERRIRERAVQIPVVERLWPIAAGVVGWRALQLFVDLPMPWLHPIVPFVAAAVAAWRFGGDFLTIETSAPELEKRGI
jgi:hypothetical protein